MSDDILSDIQAVKERQSSIRARLQQKKKEREGLQAELRATLSSTSIAATSNTASAVASSASKTPTGASANAAHSSSATSTPTSTSTAASASRSSGATPAAAAVPVDVPVDEDAERKLLLVLCDISLDLPSSSTVLAEQTSTMLGRDVALATINALLEKFAQQKLLSISKSGGSGSSAQIVVNTLDINKLLAVTGSEKTDQKSGKRKREIDDTDADQSSKQAKQKSTDDSIESLLNMQSAKEREEKKVNEEILSILNTPTAKEMSLVEKFKTRGGPQLQEFCQYGTREECMKLGQTSEPCKKLHFKKIIRKHTDESLGDCSFLNTCFHMDVCKFVHYEIDHPDKRDDTPVKKDVQSTISKNNPDVCMFPPQWIQCDLRTFDMSVLGKCAVVMADPPWDIHMELPYGTMSDDEMRKLPVPILQDDGFLFLWVTGRAMELGRECLELWGYKRADELIWVKTNQLQRIIRTGRTGHWINHGKEHCLVGVKGNPKGVNKGLDCDVIVAEVRATSHKPDEIYGIIERLSPGTRKVELFGRPHNVQPNWITLGNQLEGVCLKDPDIVSRFREVYPDGNCLAPVAR